MVVVDLDGTLARSDHSLSPRTLNVLEELGKRGIPRIVATGRSLHATRKILGPGTPFDYLIFSTGAGTATWPDGRCLESFRMERALITRVSDRLTTLGLDYMLHGAIPDNHFFTYYGEGNGNPDFHERISRGDMFAKRGNHAELPDVATQFLIVANPSRGPMLYRTLKTEFLDLSVVRATSPLDHRSIWIEIFPSTVSKGQAARSLASRLGVDATHALAIGNDYNDLDLLQWAGTSYLLSNSPAEIQSHFRLLPTNDQDGVAVGIETWLGRK